MIKLHPEGIPFSLGLCDGLLQGLDPRLQILDVPICRLQLCLEMVLLNGLDFNLIAICGNRSTSAASQASLQPEAPSEGTCLHFHDCTPLMKSTKAVFRMMTRMLPLQRRLDLRTIAWTDTRAVAPEYDVQ
jgi:hypothetical protein